jgi:MFS family permease
MISLAFALHAIQVGSLISRLPEVQRDLALGEFEFSLVLMAATLGFLLSTPFTDRVIRKLGIKPTFHIFFLFCAVVQAIAILMPSGIGLGMALFFAGIAGNYTNIAINIEADRIEARDGVRIMNFCHGIWAVALLLSTGLATVLIAIGASVFTHFLGVAIATGLCLVLIQAKLDAAPPRAGIAKKQTWAIPDKSTFILLGYLSYAVVLEWLIRGWAIIYLRDTFAATDTYASLALPVMISAIAFARLRADTWISHWGVIKVTTALLLGSCMGIVLLVVAPSPELAFAGLIFIGLGISVSYPVAFSTAARWGGANAADRVAALSLIQQFLLIAIPPIFGILAQVSSLRIGFAVLILFPIMGFFFNRKLAD